LSTNKDSSNNDSVIQDLDYKNLNYSVNVNYVHITENDINIERKVDDKIIYTNSIVSVGNFLGIFFAKKTSF